MHPTNRSASILSPLSSTSAAIPCSPFSAWRIVPSMICTPKSRDRASRVIDQPTVLYMETHVAVLGEIGPPVRSAGESAVTRHE
jgi:hypothetical protein